MLTIRSRFHCTVIQNLKILSFHKYPYITIYRKTKFILK
uniref:Uncharacterized protein n=1 Tax=Anguilla anguilla TaxID=7936 RepID=A0A0E9W5T7_ANGAN